MAGSRARRRGGTGAHPYTGATRRTGTRKMATGTASSAREGPEDRREIETMTEMKHFIEAMPKAELHVHVEGTLEPELKFELAHGIAPMHRSHPAYRYMPDGDADGAISE